MHYTRKACLRRFVTHLRDALRTERATLRWRAGDLLHGPEFGTARLVAISRRRTKGGIDPSCHESICNIQVWPSIELRKYSIAQRHGSGSNEIHTDTDRSPQSLGGSGRGGACRHGLSASLCRSWSGHCLAPFVSSPQSSKRKVGLTRSFGDGDRKQHRPSMTVAKCATQGSTQSSVVNFTSNGIWFTWRSLESPKGYFHSVSIALSLF